MKKTLLFGVALAIAFPALSQTIAQWTFETSQPLANPGAGVWLTNINAEVGTGVASALHVGASVYTTPVGNGSVHSFSSTNWAVGDLYQFEASTAGFSNISVSWDQASSATGPGKFNLQYSTDGTTFTTFVTDYTVQINGSPNTAWTSATHNNVFFYSYDLSAITVLNNAATAYFRLVDDATTSANGGTTAAAGSDRVDNFTIQVVPEPSTFAMMGLGAAAGMFILIRRKV